jgi:hypothetical protein
MNSLNLMRRLAINRHTLKYLPMGVGGATYHVMINNYHNGDLMKSSIYGWQIHSHPKTILQVDDVAL